MLNDASKFHWAEGMRYAHEAIKLLFVLNGASAVAILTFIGNAKIYSDAFILSMIFFALGSVAGISSMLLAYLTQLQYGNAECHDTNKAAKSTTWNTAQKYHHLPPHSRPV